MKRALVLGGVGWLAWRTGGFGLLALLHGLVVVWVAVAPPLFEAGLLLAWLWGMLYVPAVRTVTVVLFKVMLVVLSLGLLLGLMSGARDNDVATAAVLMD